MGSEVASSKLGIVYDNRRLNSQLKPAWGFACWVETDNSMILFDTGGDAATLMSNLSVAGLNSKQIDTIVISHNHRDHTAGLDRLVTSRPFMEVFVPATFPWEIRKQIGKYGYVIPVSKAFSINKYCWSTGEIGTEIPEQSLAVQTSKGLILITGCAHPGICEVVQRAKEFGIVYMVIGGFHLGHKNESEVANTIEELKQLGVQKVAPCHCTGEQVIRQFRAAFQADFIPVGVGSVITV